MSVLEERAIETAGLLPLLEARRGGLLPSSSDPVLRSADLLALGALADRVRRDEVGDEVRIYAEDAESHDARLVVLPASGAELTGLELLREVAIARVSGPRRARIRVDFTRCGLELAQVALGFGADELVGRIADKRGLPLAEGELLGVGKKSRLLPAELVKKNELAGFVERAGRTPRFAEEVA